MDVDVVLLEEALGDPERLAIRPRVRHRRPRRLLHHVAELAGEDQLALALHEGDLDGEQIAPDARHGSAGRDADLVLLLGKAVLVARHAKVVVDVVALDNNVLGRIRAGELARDLPAQRADLPLEVPDAGLLRVLADQRLQRAVLDIELLCREPV